MVRNIWKLLIVITLGSREIDLIIQNKTISKSTLYLSSFKKRRWAYAQLITNKLSDNIISDHIKRLPLHFIKKFDYQVFLLRQRACDLPDLHQQLHHPLLLPEVLPVHLPDELLQTKHLKSNQISKVKK